MKRRRNASEQKKTIDPREKLPNKVGLWNFTGESEGSQLGGHGSVLHFSANAPSDRLCSPEGKYVRKTKVRAQFKALLKAAALPAIRFHHLRHSFATIQLESGVNYRVLQERLGHLQVTQTLGTYSHVTKSASRDAADRVELALFGKQEEPPGPPAAAAGA